MRRCFLHIGLHKTGTTSIQWALNAHRERLAARGFLYPATGRAEAAPDGHHNIAWELSNDRRFDRAQGTVRDLFAEAETSDGDLVLSSEDFSSSVYCRERFAAFVEDLRTRDFDPVFIVYLRNQVEQAQTLYLTLIVWKLAVPFAGFVDEILERGEARYCEWTFPFDYVAFLERLASFDGTKTIVRSYDALAGHGLVDDFLAILNLDARALVIGEEPRLNRRHDLSRTFGVFYRNVLGKQRSLPGAAALSARVPENFEDAAIGGALRRRLEERFAASNAEVSRRYRIPPFAPARADASGTDPGLPLEDVFSTEMVERLAAAAGRASPA